MKRTDKNSTAIAATLALLGLATGCGSVTSATGEYGRIDYALSADYEMDDAALTEVSILTGHPQYIVTNLTSDGEEDADNPGEIEHRVTPSEGVLLAADEVGADIDDIEITVSEPGTYLIESVLAGVVFDRIELSFDAPSSLDAMTWLREPGDEEFVLGSDESNQVTEGTQAAFLAIPMDAEGERIVGRFDMQLSADPDWMVVPDWSVAGTYEQQVSGWAAEEAIYFIEPGSVSITLADEVNGVQVSRDFVVSGISE